MDIKKIIGDNVKELRKIQGFTQGELADLIDSHRDFIGGIERGKRNITVESLNQIAHALQVEPQILLIERAVRLVKG